LASGTHVWEGELDRQFLDYLDDHRIYGAVVLPPSIYIEMAMAAMAEAGGTKPYILAEVELHKALFLPEGPPPIVQVILSPGAGGKASFRVYSRSTSAGQSDKTWSLHVTGQTHHEWEGVAPALRQSDLQDIRIRCLEEISGKDLYAWLEARGNQWGPCFQGIKRLWRGDREALGEVRVPPALEPTIGTYQFHPVVFDTCDQVLSAIIPFEKLNQKGAFVGAGINQVRLYGRPCGSRLWSHARIRHGVEQRANILEGDVLEGDVRIIDESGRIVLESIGVRLYYLDHHAHKEAGSPSLTREALLAAEPAEGHQLLASYLCERMAKILGLAVSRLDVQQPVNALGLDSLMVLELKNQIQSDLGVAISLVDLFKGPTIVQLTAQLFDRLTTLASTPSKPLALTIAPSRAKELLAQLDQLSDEKVDSLLDDLVAAEEGGE
jgi:acyl transferase domain-containing protein